MILYIHRGADKAKKKMKILFKKSNLRSSRLDGALNLIHNRLLLAWESFHYFYMRLLVETNLMLMEFYFYLIEDEWEAIFIA